LQLAPQFKGKSSAGFRNPGLDQRFLIEKLGLCPVSINCKKCELPLRPTQKFCPRCGSQNDWRPDELSNSEASAVTPDVLLDLTVTPPLRKPDDLYAEGVAHFRGTGGNQDHSLAIASFMNAADLGHSGAMYAVGVMYLRGLGIMANPSTGAEHLTKAATAGFSQADKLLSAIQAGADTSKFPVLPFAGPIAASSSEPPPFFKEADKSAKGLSKALKLAIAGVMAVVIVCAVAYGYDSYHTSAIEETERQQKIEAQMRDLTRRAEEERNELRTQQDALAEQRARLDAQEAESKSKGATPHEQEQQ